MKRIIGGVTYNTNTSTPVAKWEGENQADHDQVSTLYQTQGGAFFLHNQETWARKDAYGDWEEKSKSEFIPMTRDQAHKWFLEDDTTVISEDVFPEPPEAAAESTASSTIYLRVPDALKQKIEARAKKEGQSINVWAMRCLERCTKNTMKVI